MKLKVPSKNYSVIELYEQTAKEMGYTNVKELQFDCRKINVAKNIQDKFYNHYVNSILLHDKTETEHEARLQATMVLAQFGPKVDENLADNEVEVFEGFIC